MSSDGSRVSGQEGKGHMLCSLCGRNEVTSKNPVRYPYCQWCHYSGDVAAHLRAEQMNYFRGEFPDATNVFIDHTGGGCFALAFYFGDGEFYYYATDGGVAIPTDDDGNPVRDGWRLVCRYHADEDHPDYEGALIVNRDYDTDETATDAEIVAAIRADREAAHAA